MLLTILYPFLLSPTPPPPPTPAVPQQGFSSGGGGVTGGSGGSRKKKKYDTQGWIKIEPPQPRPAYVTLGGSGSPSRSGRLELVGCVRCVARFSGAKTILELSKRPRLIGGVRTQINVLGTKASPKFASPQLRGGRGAVWRMSGIDGPAWSSSKLRVRATRRGTLTVGESLESRVAEVRLTGGMLESLAQKFALLEENAVLNAKSDIDLSQRLTEIRHWRACVAGGVGRQQVRKIAVLERRRDLQTLIDAEDRAILDSQGDEDMLQRLMSVQN
jgi:hypothetical protein